MINLEKGQKVKLQDVINPSMPFELEINIKGNAVYDFSCFGLDNNRRSRDEYFVFFNNLTCPDNAIVLKGATNPAVFDINLSSLPPDIIKLGFTATIDGNATMGQISNCSINIRQNNTAYFQMQMSGSDFRNQKAIIAIEIYKKDVWRLSAVGDGFDGGLSELLKFYGLEEADDSDLPPTPSPPPESPPPPRLQALPENPPPSRPQTPPPPNTGGVRGQAMQETYQLVDGRTAYKYDGEEFIKSADDWV
jgi:stress response protein SCP2